MKNALAITGLILVVLAAFAPVLFGSKLLFDSDTLTYDYPLYLFYASAETKSASGWNPYYLMGYPSQVSPIGNFFGFFDKVLIAVVGDALDAYNLRMAIFAIAGVLLAFAFGRAAGFGRTGAVVLALAYFTGQTFSVFTSGLVNAGAFFIMPAVFWLALSFRNGAWFLAKLVLGAAAVFLGWRFGFAQTVFYSVLLVLAYAIYLDYTGRGGEETFLRRWRSTAGWIFMTILGTVAALPHMAGTILIRSLTLRTAGFGSNAIDGFGWGDLMSPLFPDYIRVPFITPSMNFGLYFGAFPLLFILIAIFAFRRYRQTPFFLFAAGAVILLLVKPLGFSWILQQLPVFSSFHTLRRLLLPASFIFGYLAAIGYEGLLGSISGPRIQRSLNNAVMLGTSIFALLALGIIAVNIFFIYLPWENQIWRQSMLERIFAWTGRSLEGATFPPEHYLLVFNTALHDLYTTFSYNNWELILPFFLLAVAVSSIWCLRKGKLSTSAFSVIVLVVTAANVLGVYAAQYQSLVARKEYLREPATVSAIREGVDQPRIVSFLTGEAAFRAVRAGTSLTVDDDLAISKALLSPNLNMIYGIPRADGYEPFITQRQHRVWREIVAPEDSPLSSTGQDAISQKRNNFISYLPLLSGYGVTHVISGYELDNRDLAPVPLAISNIHGVPLYLYRNTAALPRVFIPAEIKTVSGWHDDFFSDIISGAGQLSVVECTSCAQEMEKNEGAVLSFNYQPGAVEAKIRMPQDGWVVVGESDFPGWRAWIDGMPSEIHTANYLIQAIRVPAGDHTLKMEYQAQKLWDLLRHVGVTRL